MNKAYAFILVALTAMSTGQAAEATTLVCSNPNPIDSRYFGMHMHRFHDQKMIPTIEFGSWRLWDAGVTWQNLEPTQNSWDFRRLELSLSIAERRSVEVGLTLGMSPPWASARPNENSHGGPGTAAEPRNFADWDNYVRTVVTRYRRRIHFYEIWNEPDTTAFYTGSVSQMVELSRRAYQIIKEVDPNATVVSPSPAKVSSIPWFKEYVAKGGLRYADVVGYHFYTNSKNPEDLISFVTSIQTILKENNINKPIWNTESGVVHDGTSNSGMQIGPAAHVSRWLIEGACLGLQRFHYYSWDNARLGLFDPDKNTVRQQALAFQQTAKWLIGAAISSCEFNENWTKCNLTRNEKAFQIIWANKTSTLGEVGKYTVIEDSFGAQLANPERNQPLLASPILAR